MNHRGYFFILNGVQIMHTLVSLKGKIKRCTPDYVLIIIGVPQIDTMHLLSVEGAFLTITPTQKTIRVHFDEKADF